MTGADSDLAEASAHEPPVEMADTGAAVRSAMSADTDRAVPPGSRHVWVDAVPDAADTEDHAGLLHRWRWLKGPGSGAGQWWALVTYLVDDDGQPEPVQVTSWVPATMVRKATP